MPETYEPHRDDAVATWIKRYRDANSFPDENDSAWTVLDDLLDDYRLHADTGTPLDLEVEGPHGDA